MVEFLTVFKNIGDCEGRQGLSIDTTLDPFLSWLDYTFSMPLNIAIGCLPFCLFCSSFLHLTVS
jgi:hypothetical protein